MGVTHAHQHCISSLDIRDGYGLAQAPTDADRRLMMLYVLKHCSTPRGLRWHSPQAMSFLYQDHRQGTGACERL